MTSNGLTPSNINGNNSNNNSLGLGMSRSSKNSSLSILALAGGEGMDSINNNNNSFNNNNNNNNNSSLNYSQNDSPTTPPLSFSSSTNNIESTTASTSNNNKNNSGFIITSRPKYYLPPSNIKSGTITTTTTTTNSNKKNTSSLPSSSPPIPSSPLHSTSLSHNPSGSSSFRSRRSSPPAPFRLTDGSSTSRLVDGNGNGNSGGVMITDELTSSSNYPEAKTTLHLSSSVDAQGRRMVNQYIRLKTIGQGSHGKVWLCAEPSMIPEEAGGEGGSGSTGGEDKSGEDNTRRSRGSTSRRHGKGVSRGNNQSDEEEEEEDLARVTYCAIKSVAREGTGRGKSLRLAKGRKAVTGDAGPGIGADDKVKREVAIMKRLDHQNVVRLKEVIDDVKSKKVFMVLEFMAGGQIEWQNDNKEPTMTVDEARRTFRDVVLGLEYLHYQGIIHRDIKPANLLWTEDHSVVKISDFGVSHVSEALLRVTPGGTETDDDKALRKTAGSPAFFAPELCHPAEYTNANGTPAGLKEEGSTYFSSHVGSGNVVLGAGGKRISMDTNSSAASTPTTLRFPTLISLPLASPSSLRPRSRPIIGKGIDVWALGVTLYCLLFGDTPFMARTEYELYNIIVREPVKVPEKMGREGAWTGVGNGWEGCGNGEEGREVVDLLRRLLEKDPAKRIGLAEVKKHPWVLRNLSSSPDTWLCDTDPSQSHTVEVTEEDLEHATQARGIPDSTLAPIRNRPGIRKALHAALIRFPAFSRMGKSSDVVERDEEGGGKKKGNRSRSKSNSSSLASKLPSRNPSDATTRSSIISTTDGGGGYSGVDLRKIISGKDRERDTSPSRNNNSTPNSPIVGGGRGGGGWGSRTASSSRGAGVPVESIISSTATTARTSRIELSRTTSNNSTRNNSSSHTPAIATTSRMIPNHLLPERIDSRNFSPAPSARSSSPAINSLNAQIHPDSNSPAGRRTFSKLLSRLGSSSSNRNKNNRNSVVDNTPSDEEVAVGEEKVGGGEISQFIDAERLPLPLVNAAALLSLNSVENPLQHSTKRYSREDGGIIDSSEFEYSSDEHIRDYDEDEDDGSDDRDLEEDELSGPALAQLTGIRGWQSGTKNFDVAGGRGDNSEEEEDDHRYSEDDEEGNNTSQPLNKNYFLDSKFDHTPKSSNHTRSSNDHRHSSSSNPRYSSEYSNSSQHSQQHYIRPSQGGRISRKSFGASSVRDGSIRNGFTGNSGGYSTSRNQYHPEEERGGEQYSDGEEEEDGTEMFVAPRKRIIPHAIV